MKSHDDGQPLAEGAVPHLCIIP